jgi:methyl-accepting chemotaxis protein
LLEPDEIESDGAGETSFGQIVPENGNSSLETGRGEAITQAFEKLVGQLQGINTNLDRQINQHEQLMDRVQKIPEILESLPAESENQRQAINAMVEQLKQQDLREQQIVETLRDIPLESGRQTNALIDMNQKLSTAADIDAQMAEGFNKFNQTLSSLNNSTAEQSDAIGQMNKTYAASDRYLKYIITKQEKRFAWMFYTTIGICTAAIITVVVTLALVLNG